MKDPSIWHTGAIQVARQRPELVALLGLQSEFPDFQAPFIPARAVLPKPKDARYQDASCETVTHPVESYIDRTYHWNQWELLYRKKTLKGLENKRSKTVQTNVSHYKRSYTFQTYDLRDKGEQTLVSTGTTMPKKVRYLAGLRGDSQTQHKVVNLTINLD